jgi:hypothetical protein
MPVGKANQTQSHMASLKIHSVHIGNGIQSQNVYQRGFAEPPEANRHVPTTYSLQKWRGLIPFMKKLRAD